MLKELLAAWRRRDALSEMFDEFDQMLDHSHWMFGKAVEVFFSRIDWQAVVDPLYDRDKQINELEQSIRASIVKHLTLQPKQDLPACLVLMSVVKDAERIGDYCKNVFEVGRFYTHEFTTRRYIHRLEEIRADVENQFQATKTAFGNSDVERARGVIDAVGEIRERAESLVRDLLKERDDLPTDEAVAYSLLSRHFKRIAAHLSNIATAVVAPVHRLDYSDESERPNKEEQ